MGFFNFFKPAKNIAPDEVRRLIESSATTEYCLVDVRQPGEYAEGHLPGARLAPLGEIRGMLAGLDRSRKTIVYCRTGSRSSSAASLLAGEGFTDVYNMWGGIVRYNGQTAFGAPEAGAFCFPDSMGTPEYAAVAWLLQDGTARFFREIADRDTVGEKDRAILKELADAKDAHKRMLEVLYESLSGGPLPEGFPKSVISLPEEAVVEGCVKLRDALAWAENRGARDVLELMMALEANAIDLYLRMARRTGATDAADVINRLAVEQGAHLRRVTEAFERSMRAS